VNDLAPFGSGIQVTPTSLQITDDLPFEDWERALFGASHIGDTVKWWIGDLLIFGESRYGERYAQVLSMPQMNEHKVRDYIYVCSRVARSRRNEKLSFSHHRVVAPLEPMDQERLLRDAASEDWPVVQLREAKANLEALRRAQEQPPLPPSIQPVEGETVDAARGVRVVRQVLVQAASASEIEAEASQALRALEEIDRTVKTAAKRDRLHEAVSTARASLTWQMGLPDPAVIIPGAAWQAVEQAHDLNGGSNGR
jgi:hypothetical protein